MTARLSRGRSGTQLGDNRLERFDACDEFGVGRFRATDRFVDGRVEANIDSVEPFVQSPILRLKVVTDHAGLDEPGMILHPEYLLEVSDLAFEMVHTLSQREKVPGAHHSIGARLHSPRDTAHRVDDSPDHTEDRWARRSDQSEPEAGGWHLGQANVTRSRSP